MLILLICLGFAGTVFALASVLLGNRSDVSRRVAELEDTATLQTHHRTAPIVKHLLSGVDKTAIAAKLAEAGWYKTTVTHFVFSRVVCFAVMAALGIFLLIATQQLTLAFIVLVVVAAAVGLALPSFALDGAIKKRKTAIGRRIPDFLDMVSTTVEAGVALNAALAIATASIKGPLAEEMEMVLSDVRLGRNRADAFNAMAQRAHQIDLSSLVMAIVQTERLGGNIGHVLDELADEARSRRLQRAESIAAALPVKMVLPMAFFMLPALFVMIFAPVVAELVGETVTAFGIILTAAAFAAFAYAGALAALTYWASVPKLDGGPESQSPPVYALVAAAAVIGAVCALHGAPPQTLAIVAATVGVLAAIWCVDVTRGIVPDVLTLVPLAALLVAGLLTGRWYVLLAALIPAIPFAVMAWRTKGLGLGWGDVKLVALGGALLGMQTAILSFALAAIAAIVVARIRRRSTEPLAFGPYLVAAIAVPLTMTVA